MYERLHPVCSRSFVYVSDISPYLLWLVWGVREINRCTH